MSQSRSASLLEAWVNGAAGFLLALLIQVIVFPVFGLHPTPAQNLKIGLIFTAASLVRSYAIRRTFARWSATTIRPGET
jgi:hypothetical protein